MKLRKDIFSGPDKSSPAAEESAVGCGAPAMDDLRKRRQTWLICLGYEKVLHIQPDHLQANANLAWMLACNPNPSLRNGAGAVSLALRADRLSGGQNPIIIGTLAAAYAEVGKFSEAAVTAQRALQFSAGESRSSLAANLRAQLALYQARSPFRGSSPAGLPSDILDK